MEFYTPEERKQQRQSQIFKLIFAVLRNDIEKFDSKLVARKIFYRHKDKLRYNDSLSVNQIVDEFRHNIKALNQLLETGINTAEIMMEELVVNYPRQKSAFSREGDSPATTEFINSLEADFYTKTETGDLIGRDRKTIHNWTTTGRLKAEETRSNKCISRAEIIRVYRLNKNSK